MSFHRLVMSTALAGAVVLSVPAAQARDPARAVAVDSVDVEQVAELAPGVPLVFTVFGTPQSVVALRIDGSRRVLALRETDAGIYEGTYVIDANDAIRAGSRVTATLQQHGAVAYAMLDEPLLLSQGTVPWREAAAADAAPVPSSSRGAPPRGAPVPLVATPGPNAEASTRVPYAGVPMPMPIPIDVAPPRALPPVIADARVPPSRERGPCSDCAVVESVRAAEAAPHGGVVGTIGGAIAGAILGKELGAAHTRRVLTVLGAIGGALAGREVERQVTRATHYDVVLRLPDGTRLNRRYEQAPPFAAGETIRLGATARGTPVPVSF